MGSTSGLAAAAQGTRVAVRVAVRVAGCVSLCAGAMAGGCASRIARAPEPPTFQAGLNATSATDNLWARGGDHASLFPPESRALTQDDAAIASRADAYLAVREEPTRFEFDSWKGAPRPTLARARFFIVSDRPTRQTYFESREVEVFRSRTVRSIDQGSGRGVRFVPREIERR